MFALLSCHAPMIAPRVLPGASASSYGRRMEKPLMISRFRNYLDLTLSKRYKVSRG
ncbi:hypothetical protein HMPREF0762_00333 [Slackia exigua ATCC 700122]|uniref:Uncharacterized protein n=1 Tax=Slackia exigua (strain ATCC 700122 / DSM 15923 / CIP 105133 / JCM 11022 / KCTC 5966 / S-7) TaxID=649764 RepID=D0WEV2_SLAES|nr:hypothetical protein HMPREF0762_00333 [Slackia exigua ATCC 700122]